MPSFIRKISLGCALCPTTFIIKRVFLLLICSVMLFFVKHLSKLELSGFSALEPLIWVMSFLLLTMIFATLGQLFIIGHIKKVEGSE